MQNKRLVSPENQQIKAMFIFKDGADAYAKALDFMKSLNCNILTDNVSRMMVNISCLNLQFVKKSWLSNDRDSSMNVDPYNCVSQIIIGGRA